MSIEKPTEIYGNENVDFNFICIERWIEAMQSINRYRGDETVLARTHTDNPATPQSRFLNGSKKQGDVNFFAVFSSDIVFSVGDDRQEPRSEAERRSFRRVRRKKG